jgi:hypothetical protein
MTRAIFLFREREREEAFEEARSSRSFVFSLFKKRIFSAEERESARARERERVVSFFNTQKTEKRGRVAARDFLSKKEKH